MPSTQKTKASKSSARTFTYTVLSKAKFDPKKKLSSQGKPYKTKKTGSYVAAKVALKKRARPRPRRIYLYRKSKIMVYSIKYSKNKDGKTKALAKLIKTSSAKRKSASAKK